MDIYNDLQYFLKKETLLKSDLLTILKSYSNEISIFDLMECKFLLAEDFKYISKEWKENIIEMQIKTFLERFILLTKDNNEYNDNIDKLEFKNYISNLKETYKEFDFTNKIVLITIISIVYANYILEEPIHPIGTVFPGSLKVVKKGNLFYCPARDNNLDNPKAFCRLCLAQQLDY